MQLNLNSLHNTALEGKPFCFNFGDTIKNAYVFQRG